MPIILVLEEYTVTEGDNITCTVTGYPVPDIVWLKNDGSVVDENRQVNGSVMATGVGNVSSVNVSMIVGRNDGGVYKCSANNSVGNNTSTINIIVQCKFSVRLFIMMMWLLFHSNTNHNHNGDRTFANSY